MKKALSLILALVLCLSLCACGNSAKYDALIGHIEANEYDNAVAELDNLFGIEAVDINKYVGIWKFADRDEYMYIYEDGTGNFYGSWMSDGHYNQFTWEVEGDYLVKHSTSAFGGTVTTKYALDNDCLLDSQKKVVFCKHGDDTTIDISQN